MLGILDNEVRARCEWLMRSPLVAAEVPNATLCSTCGYSTTLSLTSISPLEHPSLLSSLTSSIHLYMRPMPRPSCPPPRWMMTWRMTPSMWTSPRRPLAGAGVDDSECASADVHLLDTGTPVCPFPPGYEESRVPLGNEACVSFLPGHVDVCVSLSPEREEACVYDEAACSQLLWKPASS